MVAEFVEKPSVEVARRYLAAGDLPLERRDVRGPAEGAARPAGARGTPSFAASLRDLAAEPDRLDEVWPTLPKIAIDHAVAEPAAAEGRVARVPGEFDWDDIGDFRSLSDVLGRPAG